MATKKATTKKAAPKAKAKKAPRKGLDLLGGKMKERMANGSTLICVKGKLIGEKVKIGAPIKASLKGKHHSFRFGCSGSISEISHGMVWSSRRMASELRGEGCKIGGKLLTGPMVTKLAKAAKAKKAKAAKAAAAKKAASAKKAKAAKALAANKAAKALDAALTAKAKAAKAKASKKAA